MKTKATVAMLCMVTLSGCQFTSERAQAQTTGQGEGLVLRRLWTGSDVDFSYQSVSPDGRFITFVNWDNGELGVRNPVTGDTWDITDKRRDGSADTTKFQHGYASVFSRDGDRLAYAWQVGGRAIELRVIDFAVGSDGTPSGSGSRVIFSRPETSPGPLDWSPDGGTVLVSITQWNGNEVLSLVASDGSSARTLKTFDWRRPGRAKFSADGRYVAYDFPSDPESPDRDLFLLSVDGTQEVRLTSGPSHDLMLDWYGDGILFQSTRGGTPGVWHQPIAQGRAAGPPRLLRADTWGHSPIGVAGDAYYFGVVAERPTLYTAAVDLAASQITSTPTALEDPYGGRSDFGWDWSPDGRSLAHLVSTGGARPQLIIRSRAGEEVRRIRLELRGASRIRWADDGAAVFVSGSDVAGQNGIHRVDVESGRLETVLRSDELSEPMYGMQFDVSPDGGTLYLNTLAGENAPIHLVAFDLRSRAERRLARQDYRGNVARSPDGTRLAIATEDEEGNRKIFVMTIGSGHLEPVFDLSPPPGRQGFVDVWSLAWAPDGESLIARLLGPGGGALQVPLDGGEPRPIEGIDRLYWRPVRLSPDGRQLIYMAGGTRGEIWVMENITAAPAGSPGSH